MYSQEQYSMWAERERSGRLGECWHLLRRQTPNCETTTTTRHYERKACCGPSWQRSAPHTPDGWVRRPQSAYNHRAQPGTYQLCARRSEHRVGEDHCKRMRAGGVLCTMWGLVSKPAYPIHQSSFPGKKFPKYISSLYSTNIYQSFNTEVLNILSVRIGDMALKTFLHNVHIMPKYF